MIFYVNNINCSETATNHRIKNLVQIVIKIIELGSENLRINCIKWTSTVMKKSNNDINTSTNDTRTNEGQGHGWNMARVRQSAQFLTDALSQIQLPSADRAILQLSAALAEWVHTKFKQVCSDSSVEQEQIYFVNPNNKVIIEAVTENKMQWKEQWDHTAFQKKQIFLQPLRSNTSEPLYPWLYLWSGGTEITPTVQL